MHCGTENNPGACIDSLTARYPSFADIYFNHLINDEKNGTKSLSATALEYVSDPGARLLYDSCQGKYRDIRDIEEEFNKAFAFYKYYFPKREIPKVATCISGFALAAFTIENEWLGISLDMFMGENFNGYPTEDYPVYIKKYFDKPYIVSKSMTVLAQNIVGQSEGNTLLDMIVSNGKVMYITDLLMPETPDSVKLEYTSGQVQWVQKNEKEIWKYLIGEKLLYQSDMRTIQKLVSPSPNSPGMPPEAPGRVANWIGMQIIKTLIDKHPEISLDKLLEMKDAQKVLEMSKYKP